jgi:hypothetical protein
MFEPFRYLGLFAGTHPRNQSFSFFDYSVHNLNYRTYRTY